MPDQDLKEVFNKLSSLAESVSGLEDKLTEKIGKIILKESIEAITPNITLVTCATTL